MESAHPSGIHASAISIIDLTKVWSFRDFSSEITFNSLLEKSNYAQNCSPSRKKKKKIKSSVMPASACKSFVNLSLNMLSNHDQRAARLRWRDSLTLMCCNGTNVLQNFPAWIHTKHLHRGRILCIIWPGEGRRVGEDKCSSQQQQSSSNNRSNSSSRRSSISRRSSRAAVAAATEQQ